MPATKHSGSLALQTGDQLGRSLNGLGELGSIEAIVIQSVIVMTYDLASQTAWARCSAGEAV
jgi:hypothetical protein